MSHFPSATLSEVCDFQNGGTPSKAIERYFTGDIPWITGADLVGPVARSARSFITEEAITSSATNKVPAGTVLLVTRTSVGKVAIAGTELCFSQDITALLPDSVKLDAGYLVHFLRTKEDHFSRYARGATIKGITRQVVADLVIPLPPLEEQRRIAAILDRAETLRTQRRSALALLDSLTQSLFLDMFGDPVANPKGFIKQPLSGVAEITTGSTPGRGSDGYYGGNIPWVKTTEVAGDEIYDTEEKLTEAGLKAIRGKLHPINSIVVAMYGQGQTRGRCALLCIEASCNQACGVIRPSEEFVPRFMFAQLLLAYERLRALGRGGNQENLNLQLLGSFEVLVPPEVLQQTFATRIASIEALKATHRRALAALDALFASLQQRAFAGDL